MAGDGPIDDPSLKGLNKYFNGTTMRGRANVAKVTYASIGLIIAYFILKPKAKKNIS